MIPKLNVLIRGIEIKISNGENLEDILTSYVNLSDEEKTIIRKEV